MDRTGEDPRAAALPESVAWTALLAHGVELAAATLALPGDAAGARWRDSVAPLIALSGVRLALSQLDRLPAADRPAARDLAAVSVRRAAGELDSIWRGEPMPESILEIAEDADRALDGSVYAGIRIAHLAGAAPCWMPPIAPEWFGEIAVGRASAAVMAPGTLVLPGSPVAWWVQCADPPLAPALFPIESGDRPLQVYRRLDERGRIEGDLVAPLEALPAGMPLLVPLRLDGEAIGAFPFGETAWRAMQEAALCGRDPRSLPLDHAE